MKGIDWYDVSLIWTAQVHTHTFFTSIDMQLLLDVLNILTYKSETIQIKQRSIQSELLLTVVAF